MLIYYTVLPSCFVISTVFISTNIYQHNVLYIYILYKKTAVDGNKYEWGIEFSKKITIWLRKLMNPFKITGHYYVTWTTGIQCSKYPQNMNCTWYIYNYVHTNKQNEQYSHGRIPFQKITVTQRVKKHTHFQDIWWFINICIRACHK